MVDRLKELHDDVSGVNVADKASDPERFATRRAEGYWRLRDRCERGPIMIPDDDELINELTSLKYKIVNSNGTIRLEGLRPRRSVHPSTVTITSRSLPPPAFRY
jgi:hypothetical protein